jgi:dethiobiotin synthetase
VSKSIPSRALFITASGTGLGKTLVTAALCHQLRAQGLPVAALKPVMSGFSPLDLAASDAGILAQSLGRPATPSVINEISGFRFRAALAPNMAAKLEGKRLSFPALVGFCRRGLAPPPALTLIEGVGGVMSPVTHSETVLDWMAALRAPVLLVVGNYLGGISHALTAVAAMRAARVKLIGVIVSEGAKSDVPIEETLKFLRARLSPAPVVALPWIAGAHPWKRAPDLTGILRRSPELHSPGKLR